MEQIASRLSGWMKDRHLDINGQRKGFVSNIQEEISEYFAAKDDNERIDALCDITVFCINAMKDYDKKHIKEPDIVNVVPRVSFGKQLDNITLNKFSKESLESMIDICFTLSTAMGYNFKVAMDETIKEISSRTGSYDESANKWIKDTSDEAKAKWYKANYELAKKLKNENRQ